METWLNQDVDQYDILNVSIDVAADALTFTFKEFKGRKIALGSPVNSAQITVTIGDNTTDITQGQVLSDEDNLITIDWRGEDIVITAFEPLSDIAKKTLTLDGPYDQIKPGGWVLIERPTLDGKGFEPLITTIETVQTIAKAQYGIIGKVTELTLKDPWLKYDTDRTLEVIRKTTVYAQSEPLNLSEEPFGTSGNLEDVKGKEIALDTLCDGLDSGRWLIVSGERTDLNGVSGVYGAEPARLYHAEQRQNAFLNDKTKTTLVLADALQYSYKRETVTIYGNVVKATHGETRKEVLGSGDGAKALQAFVLKQPPLTFVSAVNPTGVDSTLKIYVNDVQWREIDSLAGLSPTDRNFITKTDGEGKTTVIFGNGREGLRLPTGIENIKAEYRNGIGKPGNVKAEQITLLTTRPLGVREIINPLPASGGADKETRDQARKNAPLAVMALDRLVSVQDYEDFSRLYAGIGKAFAVEISDGRRQLVHITIAGADDIPIDKSADLYRNLHQALLDFGDPYQAIQLEIRELMLIVVSAGIRILPDYQWEPVVTQVRSALLDAFSFERRELGQDVLLSEVISIMQRVPGVAYVDVDIFGGLPEKKVTDGKRELLTPSDIADVVKKMGLDATGKKEKLVPDSRVPVNLAKVGSVIPAQLAFLTPEVPETLILNQIT